MVSDKHYTCPSNGQVYRYSKQSSRLPQEKQICKILCYKPFPVVPPQILRQGSAPLCPGSQGATNLMSIHVATPKPKTSKKKLDKFIFQGRGVGTDSNTSLIDSYLYSNLLVFCLLMFTCFITTGLKQRCQLLITFSISCLKD